MAKVDYISIADAMPPEGTSPKVMLRVLEEGMTIPGVRQGRIAFPSDKWDRLVAEFGPLVCWKAHTSEGGAADPIWSKK